CMSAKSPPDGTAPSACAIDGRGNPDTLAAPFPNPRTALAPGPIAPGRAAARPVARGPPMPCLHGGFGNRVSRSWRAPYLQTAPRVVRALTACRAKVRAVTGKERVNWHPRDRRDHRAVPLLR